jgi:CubicO group peptidase (beta-lactamase class C family)
VSEPADNAADWMAGFPPPADKILRFADGSFYEWPKFRWSFNHLEQLVPTKSVWRGPGAARELTSQPQDLSALITDEWLESTCTDGLAIMHRGRLVYEQYFAQGGPHVRHALMSCNKSMVGVISECLIESRVLDDTQLVPHYVPELGNGAYANATVRQVLDMTISMVFHEDYMVADSDVWKFMRSSGMIPRGPDDPATIAEFLPTIQPDGPHGEAFAYREPNIFVLGWIVRRAAQADIATLASELVWQHVGAEHDWLYMVDASGAETTASATLRDFVRFGELVLNRGRIDDRQIVPAVAVDRILAGGDQEVFARSEHPTLDDYSYKSQWWVRHVDGRICPSARGAHGQLLYLDPTNDLVIARFGSSQHPPSAVLDPVIWPVIDAITDHLVS